MPKSKHWMDYDATATLPAEQRIPLKALDVLYCNLNTRRIDLSLDLARAFSVLKERERVAIIAYYLLEIPVQDIADHYNITGVRVRQIIKKGLRRLRASSSVGGAHLSSAAASGLKSYLSS